MWWLIGIYAAGFVIGGLFFGSMGVVGKDLWIALAATLLWPVTAPFMALAAIGEKFFGRGC